MTDPPKVNQTNHDFTVDESGWHVEAQFLAGKDGDGLILKNLRHDNHWFAQDVRIKRIYIKYGSSDPVDERSENFALNELEPLGIPQVKYNNLRSPRDHYKSEYLFSISQRFIKRDLSGLGDEDLVIEQEYLFTRYSNSPPHEPLGIIKAARFYPMLRFHVVRKKDVYPDRFLQFIRADYRFRFQLEQPLGKRALRNNDHSSKQEIGIFRDEDLVALIVPPVPWKLKSAKTIFRFAEKPLYYSIIGVAILSGKSVRWDNIHQYSARQHSSTGPRAFPPTPGTPYAVHIHWRWSEALSGAPIIGGPIFSGHGGLAGGPMTDPAIPDQDLFFAITDISHIYSVSDFFPDSITNGSAKPPLVFDKGKLFTYLSVSARRKTKKTPFSGTFFPQGIFFAHNYDPTYSDYAKLYTKVKDLSIITRLHRDHFEPQYFRRFPVQKWVR